MHIRFHYKIESQLKCANTLELSPEQVLHEPSGGASHVSLNFSLTRGIALLGQISGQEVSISSINAPFFLFRQNYSLPTPSSLDILLSICYFPSPLAIYLVDLVSVPHLPFPNFESLPIRLYAQQIFRFFCTCNSV